jgi:hypothetical protein
MSTLDVTTLSNYVGSKTSFEPQEGTYAVEIRPGTFDYFKIKVGSLEGNFVRLEVLPPLIREGRLTYKGNVYSVSDRDIRRSRFDVRNIYAAKPGPTSPSTKPKSKSKNESKMESGSTDKPTGQQSLGSTSEFEELKDADMAWEDQVQSLQHFLNT